MKQWLHRIGHSEQKAKEAHVLSLSPFSEPTVNAPVFHGRQAFTPRRISSCPKRGFESTTGGDKPQLYGYIG
ncbi:unnamed protein product [Fusarium graminearum]|uniref:Uncharacterized protein n=1 Tax=Gibberella zeae TaxID=5518 RepID=A0A9N8WXZ7_GIBZA|nr:unnamed protein product [Fusarium graminearum]CAG1974693.1 unnamed protein product [Fusarium graminearum]CAG2006578.1 unnamed protein product [Fusarium graminearum]